MEVEKRGMLSERVQTRHDGGLLVRRPPLQAPRACSHGCGRRPPHRRCSALSSEGRVRTLAASNARTAASDPARTQHAINTTPICCASVGATTTRRKTSPMTSACASPVACAPPPLNFWVMHRARRINMHGASPVFACFERVPQQATELAGWGWIETRAGIWISRKHCRCCEPTQRQISESYTESMDNANLFSTVKANVATFGPFRSARAKPAAKSASCPMPAPLAVWPTACRPDPAATHVRTQKCCAPRQATNEGDCSFAHRQAPRQHQHKLLRRAAQKPGSGGANCTTATVPGSYLLCVLRPR